MLRFSRGSSGLLREGGGNSGPHSPSSCLGLAGHFNSFRKCLSKFPDSDELNKSHGDPSADTKEERMAEIHALLDKQLRWWFRTWLQDTLLISESSV